MNQRYPSVPLITSDPYFSLWSPADQLTEADTVHWTGKRQKMSGKAIIDGSEYRFLGKSGPEKAMSQSEFTLTATSSSYTFQAAGVELDVIFTSPLLLSDLDLVSRPITYLTLTARPTDGKNHSLEIVLDMDETHCRSGEEPEEMTVINHTLSSMQAISLGKKKQTPLNHSGDAVSIDWGYLYLGLRPGVNRQLSFFEEDNLTHIRAHIDFGTLENEKSDLILLAYDDTASIIYFGEIMRAWWAREGKTIFTALEEALAEYDVLMKRCELLDEQINEQAEESVSPEYAEICSLAYRQSIAAHKLIADSKGEAIFLSKECHSNGCIGTVDVSYPSIPLFLLYNAELVKGMMRPVLEFSRMAVWEYDFAPHDVGRYPFANGQVYALKEEVDLRRKNETITRNTIPPYYSYPKGSDIYNFEKQMPVEECGNMLIMAAAVYQADGDCVFVQENMDLYEIWVTYLLEYGRDPGHQLCTDDFAGHLAHNINLSAKAIMGIAAYSLLLSALERENEADMYYRKAESLAADWEERAFLAKDHTALTFDNENSWGQKYNLVWDLVFGTGLFSREIFEKETAWYLKQQEKYGMPLDNRALYTKSDWITWCAAMAETQEERAALINPIHNFLRETPDRAPFSDWYETDSGKKRNFQNRSVQGGLFMPLLMDRMGQE
jgi:hypothetical protein